jgi:heptosyltransferase-2
MKIVIRAPNWIGDAVLALPVFESVRHNFPQAEVWIAGREWIQDLFPSLEGFKGLLSLPDEHGWAGFRKAVKIIKDNNFDAGLLLPNSFRSALLFYLARIPQRWGYNRDGRRFLLTKRVPSPGQTVPLHQAQYYLKLIEGLGLKPAPGRHYLKIDAREIHDSRLRLESLGISFKRPLVALNPGAQYGSAKRWPAQKFADLALLLQQRKNADILVVGAEDEVALAEDIAERMKIKPQIMSGKTTLSQLAGLLHHAQLLVTNDSGPMHMASALRTPVVAVFGPTEPARTGPFHQPAAVVSKEVDCWPCRHRECPSDHRCMTEITAEDVFRACEEFLE